MTDSKENHNYWEILSPPLLDQMDSQCECCNKGVYKERSLLDHYRGVIVCNKCGFIKPRWVWILEYSN